MVIELNGKQFGPGQIVMAEFVIPQNLPSRLRNIELAIELIENTSVVYTTYNGSTSSRHRTTETFVMARSEKILDPETIIGTHSLEMRIPQEVISTMEFDGNGIDIEVIGHATIKYDRMLGFDEHEEIFFDVVAVNHPSIAVSDQIEGLQVSLADNLIFGEDRFELDFKVEPGFEIAYRSVRIELEHELEGSANGHSNSEVRTDEVLAELDQLPQGKYKVQIPDLVHGSAIGKNFTMSHIIKIVLDKRLASDYNLILPVNYMNFPRTIKDKLPTIDQPVKIPDTDTEDPVYDDMPMFSSKPLERTCINCGSGFTGDRCDHCGKRQ